MTKTYCKPMVTRVELRPTEATLSACKLQANMYAAYTSDSGWGCQLPNVAKCLTDTGS
jgi:hypothetical protein